MAEGHSDVMGDLLSQLQALHPQHRILILDLPRDVKLRAVGCKPSEHDPPPTVALTIVLESVDFVAMQEIAKRLTTTAAASEAALAARKRADASASGGWKPGEAAGDPVRHQRHGSRRPARRSGSDES